MDDPTHRLVRFGDDFTLGGQRVAHSVRYTEQGKNANCMAPDHWIDLPPLYAMKLYQNLSPLREEETSAYDV